MKKRIVTGLVLLASVMAVSKSMAESQTLSLGYAHGKIENAASMNGINLQYRYEWDNDWGIMGAFTWMKGSDSLTTTAERDRLENHYDAKYYSLQAGPTYRINDIVSLYGTLGMAQTRVSGNSDWYNYEGSPNLVHRGTQHFSFDSTSLSWGVGVTLNPMQNLAVNVGYEGAQADLDSNRNITSFNIGVGYRF